MNTTDLVRRVRETRDIRPWIREKAVNLLMDAEYGHLVSMEILANTPIRSRYKGKFCVTRHVKNLYGVVMDSVAVAHSVWFCPAARNESGNGQWMKIDNLDTGVDGWLCSTCIHTQDRTEIVQAKRAHDWVMNPIVQSSRKDYPVPSGERAQNVLAAVAAIGVGSMEEILGTVSGSLIHSVEDAIKDMNTTANTVYRLFKTGIIQKLGRGKKAVYSLT